MLIIGISGVTTGGKTTLSKNLLNEFPRSAYLCQDNYFFKRESGKLEFIEDLKSHNFDCIEAIDSEKFFIDLNEIIENKKHLYDFLIIDGFMLFEYVHIDFAKMFFFTLTKEQCLSNRLKRNYKTVGSVEYFENCVWPNYLKYYEKCKTLFSGNIIYLNGNVFNDNNFSHVKQILKELI
jgi:nicotinamide/nicotinate riboside kinase